MVYPHTQRPICSIFLSWIAVLNNVGPRLWWPGEYSIVFRGTTDKIWSLLPIHHSNLNRDFKLRPPNVRKFWSTATATAICKSWWWLRLPEPIHGKFGRGCRWKSRLRLKIAVVDGALYTSGVFKCNWLPLTRAPPIFHMLRPLVDSRRLMCNQNSVSGMFRSNCLPPQGGRWQ